MGTLSTLSKLCKTRLCLLVYFWLKETGWVHPLMPLGYFFFTCFLSFCMPASYTERWGSELRQPNHCVVSQDGEPLAFGSLLKWDEWFARVTGKASPTRKTILWRTKRMALRDRVLTSISFPIQSQKTSDPLCLWTPLSLTHTYTYNYRDSALYMPTEDRKQLERQRWIHLKKCMCLSTSNPLSASCCFCLWNLSFQFMGSQKCIILGGS